ncbi:MAG: DUF2461 domain-containing protein [Candidatus Symbiothrix sp.]|jgi:uncharacterized protein (TIGR02453 family)|nr:DUF2461 domain-containing protein [Candidatus Symbiothrix sp.]
MKTSAFAGFSPQTFQFFAELEMHNYKAWFEEHKPVYEQQVMQPLKALATALTPFFASVDSQMDLRLQKIVSRIYRDIRFSKDKTPYKSQLWLSFQRPFASKDTAWLSFPGFYMEINKTGINYGMGLYAPQKKIMDRFREIVEYDPQHFKTIVADLPTRHGFQLGGESYQRPLKNDLDNWFQTWIQRRGIYLYKHRQLNDRMYSTALLSDLEKEFALLQPLYDFFVEVCD